MFCRSFSDCVLLLFFLCDDDKKWLINSSLLSLYDNSCQIIYIYRTDLWTTSEGHRNRRGRSWRWNLSSEPVDICVEINEANGSIRGRCRSKSEYLFHFEIYSQTLNEYIENFVSSFVTLLKVGRYNLFDLEGSLFGATFTSHCPTKPLKSTKSKESCSFDLTMAFLTMFRSVRAADAAKT